MQELHELASSQSLLPLIWSWVLGKKYKADWHSGILVSSFRTRTAARSYQSARDSCLTFVEKSSDGAPDMLSYFEAVANWEMTLLNLHLGIDPFRGLLKEGFIEDDSIYRTRQIVNRIKHVADDIGNGIHKNLKIPMWMTKEGLTTRIHEISYKEIYEILNNQHKLIAKKLSYSI